MERVVTIGGLCGRPHHRDVTDRRAKNATPAARPKRAAAASEGTTTEELFTRERGSSVRAAGGGLDPSATSGALPRRTSASCSESANTRASSVILTLPHAARIESDSSGSRRLGSGTRRANVLEKSQDS